MSQPFMIESRRAREAQRTWCREPLRHRLKRVRELRYRLVEGRQALLEAVELDVRRAPAEVLTTDILAPAAALQYLEEAASKILAPIKPGHRPLWLFGSSDTVYREPHGIVGLIATWNYPIYLTLVPLVQALVAGNAVLWKPSEQTPHTAKVLADLLHQAGFPPGLVQKLPGTREAGPQLAEADIDFLHFTGSDHVGRALAARLGERLIPSVLELSGIDAMIVLADADLELAARSAWYGTTLNHGQTCLATRRVFVHKSVLVEFVEKLKPLVEASEPVRLQTEGQANHARNLIANAKQQQAQVLLTARTNAIASGYTDRVSPAVIVADTADLAICRQATFAPILAVMPFDNPTQAVQLHNHCQFGLGGSIFTADRAAGEALAHELNCGAVVINDVIVPTAHPATPFGGRHHSGWGATQGADGLLAMTVPKVVSYRSGRYRPHVDGLLNPTGQLEPLMEGMLLASHARTWSERVRGWRQMLHSMWKKPPLEQ